MSAGTARLEETDCEVQVDREGPVANRGEIAVRAFRAAHQLGIETVAIYPYEDRRGLHRTKADQIGEAGHPVRAYLSIEEIVNAAKRSGADRDDQRASDYYGHRPHVTS